MENARNSSSPPGEDRLSSLNDHVLLDGIITLLPIEDLMSLSLASKRFEELCTLTPSLDVDMHIIEVVPVRIIMKFLKKCISSEGRSDGRNKLRLLCIRWKLDSFYRGRSGCALRAFLCQALNQWGLESLSLDLWEYCLWKCSPFELEIDVDSDCFTSLKHIELNFHLSTLALPITPAVFPNLESLELKDITIRDDWFYHQLSDFRFLKQLVFINVEGAKAVCITCPSLEKFSLSSGLRSRLRHLAICGDKLSSVHVNWEVSELPNWHNSPESLQIVAPNLKDLVLESNVKQVTVNGVVQSACETGEALKEAEEESSDEHTDAEDVGEEQDTSSTTEE